MLSWVFYTAFHKDEPTPISKGLIIPRWAPARKVQFLCVQRRIFRMEKLKLPYVKRIFVMPCFGLGCVLMRTPVHEFGASQQWFPSRSSKSSRTFCRGSNRDKMATVATWSSITRCPLPCSTGEPRYSEPDRRRDFHP